MEEKQNQLILLLSLADIECSFCVSRSHHCWGKSTGIQSDHFYFLHTVSNSVLKNWKPQLFDFFTFEQLVFFFNEFNMGANVNLSHINVLHFLNIFGAMCIQSFCFMWIYNSTCTQVLKTSLLSFIDKRLSYRKPKQPKVHIKDFLSHWGTLEPDPTLSPLLPLSF